MCVERGEREALFILVEVGSRQMHVWKVIRRLRGDSSSKCTWTGGWPGSASASPTWPPLVLILRWQADIWALISCMYYAWHACLLCQMGPLCKWVTPNAILCVVVWRLLCVFVFFRSCSSKMYKTRKQLWSEVSDTNM